jgi:hypothetical protein
MRSFSIFLRQFTKKEQDQENTAGGALQNQDKGKSRQMSKIYMIYRLVYTIPTSLFILISLSTFSLFGFDHGLITKNIYSMCE